MSTLSAEQILNWWDQIAGVLHKHDKEMLRRVKDLALSALRSPAVQAAAPESKPAASERRAFVPMPACRAANPLFNGDTSGWWECVGCQANPDAPTCKAPDRRAPQVNAAGRSQQQEPHSKGEAETDAQALAAPLPSVAGTPLTDAIASRSAIRAVPADFARELERAGAAMREALRESHAALLCLYGCYPPANRPGVPCSAITRTALEGIESALAAWDALTRASEGGGG